MTVAFSLAFYLHTVLCAAYIVYLAREVGSWVGHRMIPAGPYDGVVDGSGDLVVDLAGRSALILYLSYAEIYLYRTYQVLGHP